MRRIFLGLLLVAIASSAVADITGNITPPGGSGGSGSGTVGSGTAGQLAGYASAGTSVAGQSLGGDCSIDSSFDITCTESDGVAIVTTTATQTLTNKTISGSSNTLTNLPAANLTGTASVNTSGTAANLSGNPALPNGTTATTQTTGDDTTKLATDAFVIANASSSGVSSAAAGGGIAITGTGSGPYTGAVTISASYSLRAVTTGSTDTILDTDCANGVNYTSSSAVAITLPQATSSFAACSVDILNNSAVTETVTPTTSTINGASSLTVPAGTSVNITALSGNYIAAGTGVGGLTHTIASGITALGTSAIASGVCASTITVSAPGVNPTSGPPYQHLNATYASDPQSVTGYAVSTSGHLEINSFMTSGDVNFEVCNETAASITPGAMSLNWGVTQ